MLDDLRYFVSSISLILNPVLPLDGTLDYGPECFDWKDYWKSKFRTSLRPSESIGSLDAFDFLFSGVLSESLLF